ncbi:MAG: diguanylate cyclase [Lachnospiraceae bacterium]|nr:diguanylate cyclase [Lachnospiraceae bacterium]
MKNRWKISTESTLIILIFIFGIFTYVSSLTGAEISQRIMIGADWDLQVNGVQYEAMDLNEFVFEQQDRGDVITLTTQLPQEYISDPLLVFHVKHSTIQVMIDGEEIYAYGQERYAENHMVGYGYHLIELPDDYGGKTLQVVAVAGEEDSYSNFRVPYICNAKNVIRDMFLEKKVILGINLFLFTFGLLILIISIFFSFKSKKFSRLIMAGMFSLVISLWSICNYDLIILYTYRFEVKPYLEFTSLYFCPLFVYLYFWSDIMGRKIKTIKGIYLGITGIQVLFIAAVIVLHGLNIVHMPAMVTVQHVIIIIMVLSYVALMIYDIVKKQYEKSALAIGMLSLVIISAFDIIRYNVLVYASSHMRDSFPSLLFLGGLIFVLSQIVDFYSEVSKKMYEGAKAEALERLAYTDALTGLSNRRKCEDIFDELEMSEQVYGILAFDLNNLKLTNDTLGHDTGDILLMKFAEVLQVVFGDAGTICRMGGDEFIVIIPDIKQVDVRALVDKMEAMIERANEEDENLNLSTAYGYCRSNEPRCKDVKSVYRKADARMYKQKTAMKKFMHE